MNAGGVFYVDTNKSKAPQRDARRAGGSTGAGSSGAGSFCRRDSRFAGARRCECIRLFQSRSSARNNDPACHDVDRCGCVCCGVYICGYLRPSWFSGGLSDRHFAFFHALRRICCVIWTRVHSAGFPQGSDDGSLRRVGRILREWMEAKTKKGNAASIRKGE